MKDIKKRTVKILGSILVMIVLLITWSTSIWAADSGSPQPVENLKVKRVFTQKDGVLTWVNQLSWDHKGSVWGYKIYRRIGKTGDFTYVGCTGKALTWTDSKPSLEMDVYYRVYACNKDPNNKDIKSTSTVAVRAKLYQCPAISDTGFKAVSTSKGAKLTWNASLRASGYLIYRRVGTSGEPKKVGVTRHLTWTDSDDDCNAYNYYWVYPYYVNSAGKKIVNREAAVYKRTKHSYTAATCDAPKT